ncbi:MAG: hypothetical protein K0U09_06845 [Proteobacteria bacterium]|nr:hypothetical protein [Pseudomonadota bacterium]
MYKFLILLAVFGFSSIGNADEFHCRITEVRDHDTNNIVNSLPTPKNNEFIVDTDTETNIYLAGEIRYALSDYKGSRVAGTNNHKQPFIVISKLDNKFFDMYLHYAHGVNLGFRVSGICKEVKGIF